MIKKFVCDFSDLEKFIHHECNSYGSLPRAEVSGSISTLAESACNSTLGNTLPAWDSLESSLGDQFLLCSPRGFSWAADPTFPLRLRTKRKMIAAIIRTPTATPIPIPILALTLVLRPEELAGGALLDGGAVIPPLPVVVVEAEAEVMEEEEEEEEEEEVVVVVAVW